MRLTDKLFAQHLGWMFRKHWQQQANRITRSTGAEEELKKLGIGVKNVSGNIATEEHHLNRVQNNLTSPIKKLGVLPKGVNGEKPCYVYGNNHVLIGGLQQALRLTKSNEIQNLPQSIEKLTNLTLTRQLEANINEAVSSSHIFDTEQVKQTKKRDPLRPMFNYPRIYNISSERRSSILINKLLTECEKIAEREMNSQRLLVDPMNFKVTLRKDGNLIQFDVSAQKVIASTRPIESIKDKCEPILPYLHYIKDTISIPKKHIYSDETFYPQSKDLIKYHPHTIIMYFDADKIKTVHDVKVNTTQFQSFNMLKAFAVAAARAKQLYGDAALDSISKPIVVQSILTDGRTFHFGVFQLNTLRIDSDEGPSNYWFHQPNQPNLFERCGYHEGRPVLEGLNMDVFRYINAFYKNS